MATAARRAVPIRSTAGDRGMRIEHAVAAFITSRRRGTVTAEGQAKEGTLRNYTSDLRYFADFIKARGHEYWSDIQRHDVDAYVDWVQTNTGWAPATQLKNLASLRAFFLFIEADDDCQEMGMRGFRRQLPKMGKMPRRLFVPSRDEIRQFLNGFKKHTYCGLRDYTVFSLIIDTGMRIGEVSHLQMKHLHLEDGFVLVPEEGKTGERVAWITEGTATDIRRWLRRRTKDAKTDHVFVSNRGKQISVINLNHVFMRHRDRLGMNAPGRVITPHTLRHFFCTEWIRKGGDIAKLKAMVGHKRMETLDIYIHLVRDESVKKEQNRISPRRDAVKRDSIKPRARIV